MTSRQQVKNNNIQLGPDFNIKQVDGGSYKNIEKLNVRPP